MRTKRVLVVLLVVMMVLGMATAGAAQDIKVTIDGHIQAFDPAPIIKDGRTLVPMRALFEALGAEVDWEADTRTAIGVRGGIVVRIPIGSTSPTVNGVVKNIDVPAIIIDGRTFIPLRFVGEALGDHVDWDGATRTVIIRRGAGTGTEPETEKEDLVVHFIDVGQGDCILIEGPTGKVMLIDAGTRSAGEKIVSYLKQARITSIDIFVGTHPHEDHIGGVLQVANAFPIKQVLDPGFVHTTKTYEQFLTYIDENDISYSTPRAGQKVDFDSAVEVMVLDPHELMEDANNSSIVLRLDHGQVTFLLTGDAEAEAEMAMLGRDKKALDSDILKVGHHGSRTSTTDTFLAAVSPEVAVIMCGIGNTYGHPHQEALDKLASAGVKIYRTDLAGDIIIKSDGRSYQVSGSPYIHTPEPGATAGKYVGSALSDKYHILTCRYAGEILPENRIWFADKTEAQAAGYVPCGVCRP